MLGQRQGAKIGVGKTSNLIILAWRMRCQIELLIAVVRVRILVTVYHLNADCSLVGPWKLSHDNKTYFKSTAA
jgi:hypothetical protein